MRRSLAATMLCAVLCSGGSLPAKAVASDRHGPQTGSSETAFVTVERPAKAKRHAYRQKHTKIARVVKRPRAGLQVASADPSGGFGGGSGLVAEARRYLGGNPTGRSSLWCADFMNLVLERTGLKGTGSRLAASFASYGRRVAGPVVGAIAVMSRGRRGGHVGVVTGTTSDGRVMVISGNHNRRVAEAPYRPGRIYAYVLP